ncbi:MAG: UDP-glucose/GDP-mannose dehydrogenase family protein, partial [Candidatus Diapherotrites archaeon]
AKRLSFTTDYSFAVKNSEIIFIAVGTPEMPNGSADTSYVMEASRQIAKVMDNYKIIVDKSTVPVGTSREVKNEIAKITKHDFAVVSNPEFLREGSALKDFLEPDRVVIGADDKSAAEKVASLYKPLNCEILITTPESAEMIKYASNSFLATKISFINEIAAICEKVGADIKDVAKGIGLDKRIGPYFLNAGAGYGGSCFPKDVKELQFTAKKFGYDFGILQETQKVNELQKHLPVKKLRSILGNLKNIKVVLFGLSFKPNTDDMREASSLVVIKDLVKEGAKVVAVDPIAKEKAKQLLFKKDFWKDVKVQDFSSFLSFEDDPYKAVQGCGALILITEWKEFLELDYSKIGSLMKSKIIIDARNSLNKEALVSLGFSYIGIGR